MTSFKPQSIQEIPAFKRFSSQRSLRNPSSDFTTSNKSTKLGLTSNPTKPPTTRSKLTSRRAFLRSYTNHITTLIDNENIENPRTQLERAPSIELTVNHPHFSKTSQTSTTKLKIMIPESNPNLNNESRTCTSIGGDRPRILLTSLMSGDLAQNRSPLHSPDAQGYMLYKGSTSRRKELLTTRTSDLSQEKTWRITTQRSVGKLGVNVRENKINKILEEVQGRVGGQDPLRETSRVFNINLYTVKTEPGTVSPRDGEMRVRIVEDGKKGKQVDEIAKKLGDYRDMFKGQLEDLRKAKSHLKGKTKSLSEKNLCFGRRKEECMTKKERIRRNFVKTIKMIVRKLTIMNLTVDDIIRNNVFPAEPYQREGSKTFIDNVKNGDYLEIKRMLNMMPYFVYDFDSLKQTALHWAAKRDFTAIIKLLLDNGADFNARDLSGRTPLFLAAKGGHINSMKLLLFYGADPTIKSGAGKLALEYSNDEDIRTLLKKAYKMHVRLSICSYKRFRQYWALLDKRDFELRKDQLSY